jgi:hypothetical protein
MVFLLLHYMTTNLSLIIPKKVQAFVVANKLFATTDFAKITSFDATRKDIASFYNHTKTFIIEREIQQVWQAYKNVAPKESWKGKHINFGVLYSKNSNTLSYINDPYTGIEVGQIILLNISFFWKIINIAVGHQVVAVNEQEKSIRTNYIDGGKAEGTQQFKLEALPNGHTLITHHTVYKSQSKFRDVVLYPILHAKAISSFHHNIKTAMHAQ